MRRKPTLWLWLLAGVGLDWLTLMVLLPLAARFDDLLLEVWALIVMLMAVAWIVHAAVMPAMVWGRMSAKMGTRLLVGGAGFIFIAGTVGPLVGLTAGMLTLSLLSPVVLLPMMIPGLSFEVGQFYGAALAVIVLTGIAAGGAMVGMTGHIMRPVETSISNYGTVRVRSDLLGGMLAVPVDSFGLWLVDRFDKMMLPDSVPSPSTRIILPLVALAGTLALFPHLLLLGLDLRRAASAASSAAAGPVSPQA